MVAGRVGEASGWDDGCCGTSDGISCSSGAYELLKGRTKGADWRGGDARFGVAKFIELVVMIATLD